ncbi:hypothetical protein [Nocardiopsis sp. NPDC006938]|uniref:hypothetical protein n=1 Tax=Nocardiopsis sp. NPDC006938 TaxID=3364337 RepID=UPI003697337C
MRCGVPDWSGTPSPCGATGAGRITLWLLAFFVPLVAVLLGAAVVDEVWVPEERVELRDEVVYAYVVQNGSQFLTVLTADTREKRVLLSSEVVSRTEAS